MKVIDIAKFNVVKAGHAYVLTEPTDVQYSQIPALHVNGNFVQPSVKLEKAIFRHIRLTTGLESKPLKPTRAVLSEIEHAYDYMEEDKQVQLRETNGQVTIHIILSI